MNKEIPVPDPFSKEYEYFFPSASWNDTGFAPLVAENKSENKDTEIDIRIPEQ